MTGCLNCGHPGSCEWWEETGRSAAAYEAADELVADAQLRSDSAHGPSAVAVRGFDRVGALGVRLSLGGRCAPVLRTGLAEHRAVVGLDHADSLQGLTKLARGVLSTPVDMIKGADMTATAHWVRDPRRSEIAPGDVVIATFRGEDDARFEVVGETVGHMLNVRRPDGSVAPMRPSTILAAAKRIERVASS